MTTRIILADAADVAARTIEGLAADSGASHHAEQSFYGVGVEALVGGEWVKLRDVEDRGAVEVVRLFDCDGERGEPCRTQEDLAAESTRWAEALNLSDMND